LLPVRIKPCPYIRQNSLKVLEQAVRNEFSRFLGASMTGATYERWIICVDVGQPVRTAFQTGLPSHQLRTFPDFLDDVRATMGRWKNAHQVPGAATEASGFWGSTGAKGRCYESHRIR
jgi:hypothetical protein